MLKALVNLAAAKCGYELRRIRSAQASDPRTLAKARSTIERFREVVSDPLNLLIARVPQAGYVDEGGCVILHNGNRVPRSGPYAYYGEFSDLLVINRGVHEPLEEFCFQTLLARLAGAAPAMLELGAYWAHYSMWLQRRFPGAQCWMVEPDRVNLRCGRNNFELNDCRGEFIHAAVGPADFGVDRFLAERGIAQLDILHADIQGHELEMLRDAAQALAARRVAYAFVSTHSEELHTQVVAQLRAHGYRVEVSSPPDTHTTSSDGFVLASSPATTPVFDGFEPLGRLQIAQASPPQLLHALSAGAAAAGAPVQAAAAGTGRKPAGAGAPPR